jgi:DNA invertase Pin-like site-specific DNA recombinase
MVKDIEDGIITAVFVYDQTRLERSVETRSILLRKFEKYKVKTYYDSGFVSSTSENKLVGNILSALGEYTIELTSAKIKLAINYNAENGKVHALPPYAYYKDENKKYAINEEQAEVIKEIYSLSLSGVGTNKIAEILNQRGVLTKYNLIGKGTLKTTNKKHKLKRVVTKNKADIKWSGNSVRGILYNKFYAGIRVFKGVEYEVPKIIDIDYWQLVNDNLKNNRNNSGKSVEHKYLLKGVLTCSICNRNYYGRSRVSLKDNAYVCSSKRHKDLIALLLRLYFLILKYKCYSV